MVKLTVSLHPKGLPPLQAMKAWVLRTEEGLSWPEIQERTTNVLGEAAGDKAVREAVARIEAMEDGALVPQTNYGNCGRKKSLPASTERKILEFVKKWRHKRFCTCAYIRAELGLSVTARTISRVLNRNGYFWRPVPKVNKLTEADLKKRKDFVTKFGMHSPDWWERSMNLVLDGVTLTMPPAPLSGKEKHAAQRIMHMWIAPGEKVSHEVSTFNRYGVQLGTKVPLWGGFSGAGMFTLRLWTKRPKMTKPEWEMQVPALKRAVVDAGYHTRGKRARVWHDNEKFLLCPDVYRKEGLEQIRFPPNSGDLNPIETVWARLRKDLAAHEQEDLRQGKVPTAVQFKLRAAQILQSYSILKPGETKNYYQKLARGMTRRLQRSRLNAYGRCGK